MNHTRNSLTRQRGVIAAVWLYFMAAVLLIGAITGLVTAWNVYTKRIEAQGYERGRSETESAYKTRDNAQLTEVIAKLKAAEKRAKDLEDAKSAADNLAVANYQKGVQDGKAKTAAFIADVRAGRIRLSDPGAQTRPSTTVCSGTGQSTSIAATSGGNGEARVNLSAAASGFLLTLTGEADDTARQLAAAQAIIVSDRVLCNAP